MKAVVTNLAEDDIIAICAYVASLPPPVSITPLRGVVHRGRTLYTSALNGSNPARAVRRARKSTHVFGSHPSTLIVPRSPCGC